MRKGSALIIGAVIAFVTVFPVGAGSISLDPANGSPDAVATVESAIKTFESTFSARAGCIGSASVIFQVLSGRKGEYRTAEAVVAVNPDREVSSMAATIYHELGHHLMLTCRAYRDSDFTEAFFAAQGIPSDRGWFDAGAGWSGIPAEHFAEAAVKIVQGSTDGRIPVSAEAVDVVRRWLNGQSMPVATTAAPAPVEEVEEVEAVEAAVEDAPVPVEEVKAVVEPAPLAETEVVTVIVTQPTSAPAGETVAGASQPTVILAVAMEAQVGGPVDPVPEEPSKSDCRSRAFRCGWLSPL